MRHTSLFVAVLAVLSFATLAVAQNNGSPKLIPNTQHYRDSGSVPATGRSGNATLAGRALMAKDGSVLLEATTGKFDTSNLPPGNIAKMQVKVFDESGNVIATKNWSDLSGGSFSKPFGGLARYQKLQFQANITGIDNPRTDVVTLKPVSVALRPELKASNLLPTGDVMINTSVSIFADAQEVNGDVGATADYVLYVDGNEVDRASRIWIDAGSKVTTHFSYTFTTPGVHLLRASLENVTPTEFDAVSSARMASAQVIDNNSVSGQLTVIVPAPVVTADMQYSASASDEDYSTTRHQSIQEWYQGALVYDWSRDVSDNGWDQSAWMSFSFNQGAAFPLTVNVTESDDGTQVAAASFNAMPSTFTQVYDDMVNHYVATGFSAYDQNSGYQFQITNTVVTDKASGNVVSSYFSGSAYRNPSDEIYWSQQTLCDNMSTNAPCSPTDYHVDTTNQNSDSGLPRLKFGSTHNVNLVLSDASGANHAAYSKMALQPDSGSRSAPLTCSNYPDGVYNATSCMSFSSSYNSKSGFDTNQ